MTWGADRDANTASDGWIADLVYQYQQHNENNFYQNEKNFSTPKQIEIYIVEYLPEEDRRTTEYQKVNAGKWTSEQATPTRPLLPSPSPSPSQFPNCLQPLEANGGDSIASHVDARVQFLRHYEGE